MHLYVICTSHGTSSSQTSSENKISQIEVSEFPWCFFTQEGEGDFLPPKQNKEKQRLGLGILNIMGFHVTSTETLLFFVRSVKFYICSSFDVYVYRLIYLF